MTISASIVADSISEQGYRLTTFLLRYPRFVHAELMTHRVFSRNASSSRAIPVKKLISDIRQDPAMFEFWGKNQKGMQAFNQLEGFALWAVQHLWLMGMWVMTTLALMADKMGAHKQTVNRMVEPWSHITVVVTSTDYGNWFALRDHPDAQPEIMWLARRMRSAYAASRPVLLLPGQWHLPFIKTSVQDDGTQTYEDWSDDSGVIYSSYKTLEEAIKVSVARCARTSYKTHDGRTSSWDEDTRLYVRLLSGVPLHASPAEHQATPDGTFKVQVTSLEEDPTNGLQSVIEDRWAHQHEHGNFTGWRQHRKMLPGENQADPAHKWDWLTA